GVLSDVDEKGTVLVRFVNEAFIEIMKKSKFENVEKALLVIFGKPYKLLMEKGGAPTENKISQFSSAQKVSSNNIQSETSEQSHNSSNILVMNPPKISQEVNHEISETVISSIQVENTYITSDEHLIKTEHSIKEISEEYSFNQVEDHVIDAQNIYEERFKRESTDKYFGEVTNTFKGKIINKNKSD
ncbi:MAG: hypothetical protein H7263_02330, partial [Candidatus Sericytochromatia bacterium]|nr:hypothetical protein [Candidatus Sericytochromatia bacterium]